MKWLSHFRNPPKTTFITHGEPRAAQALKEKIEGPLHWDCRIPEYLEKIDLF